MDDFGLHKSETQILRDSNARLQGCSLSAWTKNGSCGGYANSNLHELNLVPEKLLTGTKFGCKNTHVH